jgi:AcrR family transcriptional regulator
MPRISAARANEQRGRILDAALTCFAREGFHAATVQDIVEESGLSPGAIYGYFKGKTEIAMAIASERHAMERRRMEFALAAPDIDTGLRRLVEGFVLELRNPKEGDGAICRAALGGEHQSTIEARSAAGFPRPSTCWRR